MAYSKAKREQVRKAMVFSGLTAEAAAKKCKVKLSTIRRWKALAKVDGDDWDKVKAAHTLAGGATEDIARSILSQFLLQFQNTMQALEQDTELSAVARATALGGLSDSYAKCIASSRRVLPETSQLATALAVLQKLGAFIGSNYPQHLTVFGEILEPFGQLLEQDLK